LTLEVYYYTVETVLIVLFGLCVGSFLNVVIYRLPNNMSLANPPSHCPNCGYELKWYDNVPILAYLFLGGKCRNCRDKISPRYIIVEMLNGALWLLCFLTFGFTGWRQIVMTCSGAIACSICICVALIDLEHKIIFDRFQIALGILGILFTIADENANIFINIISAFAVGLIFYLIGFIVSRKVGQEALGGGDVKFSFVAGLFLGWQRFVLMSLISSVTAAVAIFAANGKTKKLSTYQTDTKGDFSKKEYPFGPFLVFGFVIALLFGTKIISSYFGLLGIEI